MALRIVWDGDARGLDLRLEGRLGIGSLHRVDEALAGAVLAGHREVTIDASALESCDAGRLRRLLERRAEPGLVLRLVPC